MFDFEHVNVSWVVTTKYILGVRLDIYQTQFLPNVISSKTLRQFLTMKRWLELIFYCSLELDGLMEAVARRTVLLRRNF